MAADESAWKNDFLSFTAGFSFYASKVLTDKEIEKEFELWRHVTGRGETNDQLKAVLTNQITTAPYLYLTRAKMLFATHTVVSVEFESALKKNNVTIEMDGNRFITKCPTLTVDNLSVSGKRYQSEEMYDCFSFFTEFSRTAKNPHDMQSLRTKYIEASKTGRTNGALKIKLHKTWSKKMEELDILLATKAMLLYATSVPFSEKFYLETIKPSFPTAEVSFIITKFIQPFGLKRRKKEFKLRPFHRREEIPPGKFSRCLDNMMIDYLEHISENTPLKLDGEWKKLIDMIEKQEIPEHRKLYLQDVGIYFREHLAPCIFNLNLDVDTKIKMLLASNTPVTEQQLIQLRTNISQNKQYKIEVDVKFEKPTAVFDFSIERKREIPNVDEIVAGVESFEIKKEEVKKEAKKETTSDKK